MSVHYHVACHDPHGHLLAVELTFTATATVTELWLPNWLPGSYLIRDFARHIITLDARQQGQPLLVRKSAKNRWQIHGKPGEVRVHYQLYAFDESVRGAYLDQFRLFFNGSSVLLAVTGQEQSSLTLKLTTPTDSHWQIATTMPSQTINDIELLTAASYQEAIDYPIAAGHLQWGEFQVAGIRHQLAFYGAPAFDMERLCRDLAKACDAVARLWGGPLPFNQYLFLVQVESDGFGGLEHRDSTALLCSRRDLPQPSTTTSDRHYRNFLALCTHEYFHAWNIKRLSPELLISPDLESEVQSEQLWWYEGITSYYDELLLLRAGLIDKPQYLQMLSETLTRVYRHQGRFRQTVAESSFDAWIKLYKADENATNSQISYYTKGALIGLALDLSLRANIQQPTCLDTLVRQLWQQFGIPLEGTADHHFIEAVEALAGAELATQLHRWLHSCEEPPIAELLAAAGVEFQLRPAINSDDRGGHNDQKPPRFALGATYKATAAGLEISSVVNGSPAHQAGLAARDLVVAWNGLKATAATWNELQHLPAGSAVELHFFRRDHLRQCQLLLQSAPADTCALRLTEKPPAFDWLDAYLST